MICFFNNWILQCIFLNNNTCTCRWCEMSLMNIRIGIYFNMCFEYMPDFGFETKGSWLCWGYSHVLCSHTETVHSVSDVVQMAPRLPGVVTIDGETHRAVKFSREDVRCGRKSCHLCKVNKRRTERGSKVETYFKCNVCNLPLCNSLSRNCFVTFHQLTGSVLKWKRSFHNYIPKNSLSTEVLGKLSVLSEMFVCKIVPAESLR